MESDPDNLELREQLVQTYFWNGLRERAIDEYHNILANQAYRAFVNMDVKSESILEQLDILHQYQNYLLSAPASLGEDRDELESSLKDYRDAAKEFEKFNEKVQKAKEDGKEIPEPDGVHPSVVLKDAETVLAQAAAATTTRIDHVKRQIDESARSLPFQDQHVATEETDREAFVRITSALNWVWDQGSMVDELEAASARGVTLADHVLGRYYSFQGLHGLAESRLSNAITTGTPIPASYYALYQNRLWSNMTGNDKQPKVLMDHVLNYASYTAYLQNLDAELQKEDSAGVVVFTESTPDEVDSLFILVDELEADLSIHRQALAKALAVYQSIMRSKLERAIFQLEEETYLIRYELGGYYLLDEDYSASIDQFRRVLDIDPLNTSAKYNLGVLYQRTGNWKRSMGQYQQVYDADPRFENVTSNYNFLARQHADSVSAETAVTADNSRLVHQTSLAMSNRLNSVLGMETFATVETARMYRAFGGLVPYSYQILMVGVSVPVTIPLIGFTLTPYAAVNMSSDLISGSIVNIAETRNPNAVAEATIIEPKVGGNFLFAIDPLSLGGSFRYGAIDESFFWGSKSKRIVSYAGEINAALSLDVIPGQFFRNSTVRLFGAGDYRQDPFGVGNFLVSALQNFDLVIHLSDDPWTNISFTEQVFFEHSQNTDEETYYAPDGVLLATGEIGVTTWVGAAESGRIGIQANIKAGTYSQAIFSPNSRRTSLQIEADARAELTLGNITYYLSAQASGTFYPFPYTDFWSGTAKLGIQANLPRLLAP